MAKSRFGYVRSYELADALLPGTFLVVRLDGKGFHRFSDAHGFVKPNDVRALDLMNAAAKRTMESETLRQHVVLAFGESDEMSFLLRKSSDLFSRRNSKILSTFVSIFTSSYVLLWSKNFPDKTLQIESEGPSFDGRVIAYPGNQEVIDYFKWRQADTHINNLYNTAFWALIQQGGMSTKEAHATLSGTVSSEKNDILFDRFGINYNKLEPIFRKGSILLWETPESTDDAKPAKKVAKKIVVVHEDLMKDSWWTQQRPELLAG